MQDLAELVLCNLQEHDDAYALDAGGGAARGRSEHHAGDEHDDGSHGPLGDILVEESGGGDEGNHLKDGASEGVLDTVIARGEEESHDEDRAEEGDDAIEAELGVAQELAGTEARDGEI